MNCPHCSASLAPDADECCNCRFSVRAIRSLLGAEWVRLERLTDNSNSLSLKEQRHLEVVLDEFERTFPQCFFAVYIGVLPPMITARDLGFWLINHGAFHTQEIAKRNDFGCALVIDESRQLAALTLGYALESHVNEAELRQILTQVSGSLKNRQFGSAVEQSVVLLGKKLSRLGKAVRLDAGRGRWTAADLDGLGLQTLRSAHQPSRAVGKGA